MIFEGAPQFWIDAWSSSNADPPTALLSRGRGGDVVPDPDCSLRFPNSFSRPKNKELRRYLFAILQPLLLCSCAWVSLSAAAVAQSDHFASLQGNQELRPSTDKQELRSSFERDGHVIPGTPTEYHRISAVGRLEWFARATFGKTSLVGGIFSAGLGTAVDSPSEYGPHWEGFGKRYGMRLTGISTGNAIEASFGAALDGEDPRYFHTVHAPFGSRVKNIVDLTFRAYHADGERHLAYARYTATFGNNFLSNTWRVPSESDWQHALIRTAEGFGDRALSNTFREFMPQVWRKIRHKPDPFPADVHRP
jgi:hypothetical protein